MLLAHLPLLLLWLQQEQLVDLSVIDSCEYIWWVTMVTSDTLHHTRAQYMSRTNTHTQGLEPACPLTLTPFQVYVGHDCYITQLWVVLYLSHSVTLWIEWMASKQFLVWALSLHEVYFICAVALEPVLMRRHVTFALSGHLVLVQTDLRNQGWTHFNIHVLPVYLSQLYWKEHHCSQYFCIIACCMLCVWNTNPQPYI